MRTRLLFFLLTLCLFIKAQAQDEQCGPTIEAISKLAGEGNYDDAYQRWSEVQNCGKTESYYIIGEKILGYKLEAPATAEQFQQYVSGLSSLYDNYNKNFPGANGVLVRKAMHQQKYGAATPDETYQTLDKAFAQGTANFSDALSLYTYFDLFYKKFGTGDTAISADDVFDRQDKVTFRLKELSENAGVSAADLKTASDAIRKMTKGMATCERLNAFYSKNFESKKTDVTWLSAASSTLLEENCTTGTLFRDIATELHKLKPSPESARNLGTAALRGLDRKSASEHFEMAALLEKDQKEKAKDYYLAASAMSTNRSSQSADYLKKAIAADPSFGKAYLLLAQLYSGASECGRTPFEKKAVYLLAAETAQRASVDPSLKPTAKAQAESYRKKGPTKAETKSAKMAGKEVKFGCWINESVTVPK